MTLTMLQNMRIAGTVLHSLALAVTAFRAAHRWRRGKLYWDDGWAIVAAILDAVVFACLWVSAHFLRVSIASRRPIPARTGRAIYFTMSLAFTTVIWAARVSIACSIMRLLPPGWTRRAVVYIIGLFGLAWLHFMVKTSLICGKNHVWISYCPLGFAFGIEKLITDAIANTLLIAIPVHILWNSTLPKIPLRMIRIVFATSITTTAIGIVHSVYTMGSNHIMEGYTTHFEAAITVMVCNLLVVVTWCYCAFRRGYDMDEELSRYLSSQSPAPLTDISFTDVSSRSYPDTAFSSRRGTSIFRSNNTRSPTTASVPGM